MAHVLYRLDVCAERVEKHADHDPPADLRKARVAGGAGASGLDDRCYSTIRPRRLRTPAAGIVPLVRLRAADGLLSASALLPIAALLPVVALPRVAALRAVEAL
ncbi:hypothetical protein [Mycetohabitans sp. B6]|uniref:hypothetical protein n=1 Tax=Mycetohabitans sp. B6 TaxID=2841843 RepID=UPI001F437F4A|nr:hypothetical protein [Mycetohabitans sp. B6]MCG1048064.1 hypothetical protein [Mycetohabitans sp. B6]